MANTTLDDLQRRALLRADMPINTQRYEDGELTNYINQALNELQDILIASEGIDRFLDAYEFATVANQSRYDLPVSFYKSAGLDLAAPNGTTYTLMQFNHSDRMLYQNATDFFSDGVPRHRYRIVRGHLELLPAPEAAYNCTLYYIPQLTQLSSTSDTVDNVIIEGWLEYVEVDVAIRLLEKDEELERAALLKQTKGVLAERIQRSTGRDLEVPEVTPDGSDTLFNLRIQARYKANMLEQGTSRTSLVTDRELTHYINRSLEELYDLIIKTYDANYFLDGYEFTATSGRRDYNLPDDFYKLGGVDIDVSGETYSLQNFNFSERNYYESSTTLSRWDEPAMHYNLQGNSLRILPAPDGGNKITLWYTKLPPKLSADNDVITNTIIRGWTEYVTTDAAIKMLNKALVSVAANQVGQVQAALQNLRAAKQELRDRIEVMAENRNWGEPTTITNTTYPGWLRE